MNFKIGVTSYERTNISHKALYVDSKSEGIDVIFRIGKKSKMGKNKQQRGAIRNKTIVTEMNERDLLEK